MFGSPGMNLMAAGVASAICILIFSNILRGKPGSSKEKKEVPVDENRCSCCLKPFLLGRGVRCNDCGGRSCRKGCSRWDTSDNAWHCLFCHQQRYWLRKNGLEDYRGSIDGADLRRYFSTAKSQVYVTGVENAATSSGSCLSGEKEEANTMETIRDLVEKIVEGLIGSVEDIPIDRLYDHPAYDKLLGKYLVPLVRALTRLATALELSLKNKPGTDSPAMAHTALREIVERAVDEARKLPSLGASGEPGRPPEGRSVEHSYEDLLATAILNKVIEKFQKEQVDGNSNVLHGKPVAAGNCASNEDEGGDEGCSSLEPLSHDYTSDCTAACLRRVKNQMDPAVSLMVGFHDPTLYGHFQPSRGQPFTIEERIEEVTTTYASDEEPKENDALAIRNAHRVPFPELGMDIIDPSQESSEDSQDEPGTPTTHIGLVSPVESWEENWLFQKKRVQTQADPVAMLVPNPSADFKALIGDKDAEDTSDLSECSSAQSDEEIEKELMEAINNVVPRSPKRSGFENGGDDRRETSNDDSKEKHAENVPEETNRKNEPLKRTEYEEVNGRNQVRNGETNGNDEAKEEKKVNETRPMNVRSRKMEDERRMSNEEFKDEESTNVCQSTEDIEIDNSMKVKSMDPLIVSQEENCLDVPKTPTSTPTWTFVPESNFENTGEEKTVSREENVLNSLESAKKKLMAVNDDAMEPFKEEETAGQQKDFHAEDIQQESEYTEHYDTATQRHLDSLTKLEGSEQLKNSSEENAESRCREAAALAKADSASHASLKSKKSEEEVRLAAPPRPGTIAEREHKKWENAPPIQNNPYSEENIQKRLLERQYSRRSSDIPGIHTELPKSNGEDLDVVLTPHEPDIKRFGRDYYINHSRASSNEKGRRSAASTSSRPSSSLSQGSSSTGPDQDQQVSLQLEKFEEASLRGSLSRRTYRDPYSSPHFAINPLLRMEFESTESSDKAYSVSGNKRPYTRNTKNGGNENSIDEFLRAENISFVLNESTGKTVFNPLCETRPSPDQDSGTYSIDSSNRESKKAREDCRRLWIDDPYSKDDQIVSSNGRRYWNFNGYKYHTFGGIKNCFVKQQEDSDEDQPSPNDFDANFAGFKFQTFGGIKRSGRVDGKGLPTYKRVTLRSSSRGCRNFRGSRSEPALKNAIPENDWLSDDSENDTIARQVPRRVEPRRRHKSKRKWKTTSCRSSSDEDWQDVDHAPDKVIMTKFLKDASRKVKARPHVDNECNYFLNTSRRRVFDENSSRSKSRQRFSDENDSLKLEPPIVPQVVERTFESLRDLRVNGKKKSPETKKNVGVRCLSDLTIW